MPTKQIDVAKYVANLDVELPAQSFKKTLSRGAVPQELIKEGEEQSFLSDKSIVSFVSGVSQQSREDILNSTFLAQLAANKTNPIEKDLTGWYKRYVEVLRSIGWVIEKVEVNNYESKDDLFEVENVIIEILTAAFGGTYIAIIKKTLDALKTMSNKNDGKIKVFEKNIQNLSKGCFQIALATETAGAVSMQTGTFLITSKSKTTKILFVKIKKDETKLDYASGQATLSTSLYATAARKPILDKLKKDISNFISEIEI